MMSKKLNFQIGLLIGEKIVSRDLLTLSTDMLKTHNIIQVSEELTAQWEEKEKRYNYTEDAKNNHKVFYENLAWYKKNVEQVYLPKEIKCHYCFYFDDAEEIGKGIKEALWDSDLSHYRFESLEKGEYHNMIILKRAE